MVKCFQIMSVGILFFIFVGVAISEDYLYAGDFMELGVGARSLGMGGAYSAICMGPDSIYYNPAGLSKIARYAGELMHAYNFKGLTKLDTITGGFKMGNIGSLGFGLQRLGIDDIKITGYDENGRPYIKETINWADNCVYFSYGRSLFNVINLGATFKYIRQGGGDWHSNGYGLDLGIQMVLPANLRFGINAQNIIGSVKWSTGVRDDLTMNLKVGGGYFIPVDAVSGGMLLAVDSDIRFAGYGESAQIHSGDFSMDMHYGGEFNIADILFIRGGAYRADFACGAGIRLKMFAVDYAFITHTELGGSHRISVGFSM